MKKLEHMTNEELAVLVEYVAQYHNNRLKTSIDLKSSPEWLRGQSSIPEGYTLFSRSSAFELLNGEGFMYRLYEQLIIRLQEPEIKFNYDDIVVIESLMLLKKPPYSLRTRDKSLKKLFDFGIVTSWTSPGLTEKGQELSKKDLTLFLNKV